MDTPTFRAIRRTVHRPSSLTYGLSLLMVVSLVGACDGSDPQSEDAVQALSTTDGFPCRVEFATTGLRLSSSEADTIDVGRDLVRDSRGRFFASSYFGGSFTVRDSAGNQLETIGREGSGPGELTGTLSIYVGPSDTLFVRDNSLEMSVFDPSHEFIRKMPLRHIVGLKPYTHFLDDGNILSSFSTAGSQPQRLFRILDRDLNEIRAFGEPGPAALSSPRGMARKTTYASDSTFWAASPREGEPGYLMEQWSTSGNLLQTIVRDVPWFPAANPSAPRSRDAPPPPTLVAVNEGPDDRLLVLAAVPNSDWQNFDDPTADDDVEADMVNVYKELIDPEEKAVLASDLVEDNRAIPTKFFGNQNRGYAWGNDAEGYPFLELYTYSAQPTGRAAGSECQASGGELSVHSEQEQ